MVNKLSLMVGIVAILFASSNSMFAQNVASSATWPLLTDGSVQNSGRVTGTAEFITSNLVYGSYSAPGTSYYTQRVKMNLWPTGQLTQLDTVYLQFSLAPQTSYTLSIDSVVLRIGAVSSQDVMANLYYSKDSTFATKTQVSYKTSVAARVGKPAGVFLNSSKLDTISFIPAMPVNAGEQFYFRVYPWVDSSSSVSGKYIALQNIMIYATAMPIPVSAGATWSLFTNGSAVVSGLLKASDISYDNTNLFHYGFSNTNGDQWSNHLPSDGAWPAESAPNFSRYAQFTIAPVTGGTFIPDSISFTQIAESTNGLRISIFTSKDSTFATKKLVADTTVPATKMSYSYPIKDTVAGGQTMYVRFFPYDVTGDPSYKLVDMSNVAVMGSTTGLAILAPTVSTANPSYVSTTFLTSGGTVSADGGGTVTSRGVCWDTAVGPTVAKNHTTNGFGLGTFASAITGLNAGTTYHIRAYASNVGGTNYGNEVTVSTLTTVVVPSVSTTPASSILAKTAMSGGTVSDWGGSAVSARGICWNTSGTPTITDFKTVDGSDIGAFSSGVTGLVGGTTYFVRAYATNSIGTGYGNSISFSTQIVLPDTTVIVTQDGSGNYTTVQAAFNGVKANYTGKWTIFVRKGSYHEKDTLTSNKPNVVLLGESRDSTIIWNDDYGDKYGSGIPGTSGTFTVTIEASDFIARNITIQNTYSPQQGVSGTQAVALRVNGDRQEYVNCKLLGYQDTYYTWGGSGAGRIYHKNCFIEGTVDFIFGRDIVVFDSCKFHEIRNGGTLTAGSTDASSQYGYVFRNCSILADSIGYDSNPITAFYLGRPWQSNPRTVFIRCSEPWNLSPAGWLAWNVTPTLYAEYQCTGAGSTTSNRVAWSSQLSGAAASNYSLSNIFAKNSSSSNLIVYDWMPTTASPADNLPFVATGVENRDNSEIIPRVLTLANFPNPFNPETKIQFSVATDGIAVVKVFNVLGQEVAKVFEGEARAGQFYTTTFGGPRFASGVYFYSLLINGQRMIKRMLLLK